MASHAMFAEVASLTGDPARARMLNMLMDGRALTASELAAAAHVTPQTASGHLISLATTGLLSVEKQGRHRYYRLASPSVARMLESIMDVAAELEPDRKRFTVGPKDAALRAARTCYDHLAGRLGVALADALIARGQIELTADAGILTESGMAFMADIGIDMGSISISGTKRSGRVLCRPCLDWSERRPHLAGALGAAICAHSLRRGWVGRKDGTRAIQVTVEGRRVLRQRFDIDWNPA